MGSPRDGPKQTLWKLFKEAHEQSSGLVRTLHQLRAKDEPAALEAAQEIISEILGEFHINTDGSLPDTENTPSTENVPAKNPEVSPKTVKDGIRSYFQPRHISKDECAHRNLRATLVEDVILALLYANVGNSRAVIYQDIADELDRLSLHDERNTTYGRINRLRKEGHIAGIDPANRNSYLLTDAGRDYVSKMLKKRLAHGHA